ncbi:MAG: hypothetical protein F6J93_34615 [Oscillatoria sp. SIO1A7]|nr:hypothetical protein [Oscillatoria sp. SIO1A7]
MGSQPAVARRYPVSVGWVVFHQASYWSKPIDYLPRVVGLLDTASVFEGEIFRVKTPPFLVLCFSFAPGRG